MPSFFADPRGSTDDRLETGLLPGGKFLALHRFHPIALSRWRSPAPFKGPEMSR
jgi:hypothetical protein